MKTTRTVQNILKNYEGENPGVKTNLARMLMEGRLGGTGKMIILPVDQGFEHGPARSFSVNPAAYDPHYHYQMAVDAGLSAYAAPLGPWTLATTDYGGEFSAAVHHGNFHGVQFHPERSAQPGARVLANFLELG